MPGSPSLFFALAILFAAGWLHLASGETCVVSNEKFDIEFVLNQDATYSYVEFVDKLKNELMPSLVYEIEGQYPGSRFGLTTFGDWYNRTGDKRDECYRLYSSLTDNSTDFLRNVRNIEMGDGGDPPESSLIGMALSVTDPQVGWSTQRVDHFGKRIVKVLAMATDSESLMPSDVTFGRPFQGYNDSCGSRPPTPEQVGKVFGTQDVFFLGLISNSTVKTIWEDYFHRMNTKGVIHALELATPEGLVDAVMDGIKEIVCSDDGIVRPLSMASCDTSATKELIECHLTHISFFIEYFSPIDCVISPFTFFLSDCWR